MDRRWSTAILAADAPQGLQQAVYWLQREQVVAFPTDTVYGLGAPLDRPAAVARLLQVKERPRALGIPLLLSDVDDLERVCRHVPQMARWLVERFWPGGLTLVLWRRPLVPDLVTGNRPTVAVRLPDHPLPRELGRRLGVPLVATSANRSGAPNPTSAADVVAQLGGRIPLVLDGGESPAARPSTIVDLTFDPPKVLRVGPISVGQVAAVIGITPSWSDRRAAG